MTTASTEVGGHVEVPADGGQGDVDDGDVHDVHEQGGHVDHADRDLLARTRSRMCRLACRCATSIPGAVR